MNIAHLGELIGKRVVVTADHGTMGYMVADKHLASRQIGVLGWVTGAVPGHGGDVVWVEQDGMVWETGGAVEKVGLPHDVSAYCHLNELEFDTEEVREFVRRKRIELRAAQNLRLHEIEYHDNVIRELTRRPFQLQKV